MIKGVLVSPAGSPLSGEDVILCSYTALASDQTKDLGPNQRIQPMQRNRPVAGAVLWTGDNRQGATLERSAKVRPRKSDRSGAFLFTDVPLGTYTVSVGGHSNEAGRSMDCLLVPTVPGGMPQTVTVFNGQLYVDIGKIAVELKQ
jgi:hypothetical protein